MKLIITEEQKNKLFIPRKQSGSDSKWVQWNKEQPIKDGKPINQYNIETGEKEGIWEEYYWSNGNIKVKGSYKGGERHGYWENYWDNGNIMFKGSYKEGNRDGLWESYWKNGNIMYKGEYKDGKEEGYWEFYYSNGNINFKGTHKNGEFIKELTESKNKLFIPRKLSKRDSRYDEWNNSQPIKDGVRINQYDEEGMRHGYWEDYHDNRNIHMKGTYKDGKKEGYWEYYHENGNLNSKGSYIDGKPHGYWEEYHSNGDLATKGYYKNGKYDGIWEFYFDDGVIMGKIEYKNGKPDGYWEEYHSNGNIKLKKLFKDGKLIRNLPLSESKNKLFIPRKLSKENNRYDEWNNSQPIKNINGKDIRINQYDDNGLKQGYWELPYNNHPERKLMQKGYYKNSKKEGRWVIFYPNRKIYLSTMFKNDEIVK